MPSATEDPFARFGLSGRGAHLLDNLTPGRSPREVEDHLRLTQIQVVGVTFDESGYRESTVEFDDLGGGADVPVDLPIAADCGDLEAANRDRLCAWQRIIHADHNAAAEHEICGLNGF
jgi:hypothetical protein